MSQPEALDAMLQQKGVLVIDDSLVQRDSAMQQLRVLGITRIWSAHNGQAALELLESDNVCPAAVCVDLEMPGMDGIEFLQHLGQMQKHPAVAVVSGANPAVLDSVGLMVEALGLSLLGVIPKPLTAGRLCQALMKYSGPSRVAAEPIARMAHEELRAALSQGRVVPYYQPKVARKTGEVIGYEALARCIGRDGKILPPAAFVDVAEQNGLMDALTVEVLKNVLRDLTQFHANNMFPTVSINLSASSLADRTLGNEIMRLVEASDMSPTALVLEITESALVMNVAATIGMLGRMRLKGFGLSLDDFGTGFSSLQQLDRLPFTELKIDRSFVSEVDRKEIRRNILASAISTGKKLNLTTVAEGVETKAELDTIKALGCQQVQGYLIAKPMPSDQVPSWWKEHRDRIKGLCQE